MSEKKSFFPLALSILMIAVALPILFTGYASLRQAESEFAVQNYAEASRQYQRVIHLLPWRRELWEKAGLAEYELDHYQSAIELLNRAPELHLQGWDALGNSEIKMGNFAAAKASYKTGLESYDSANLYAGLASVYRHEKNWLAESDALQNQIRLDSNNPFAHYRLGLLYALLNPQLALPELRAASLLNPEVDSAAQAFRSALNLASIQADESERMLMVGRAFGLVEEWDLAQASFMKATEVNPGNAEAWAWLGEANQHLGQEGSRELERALSLDETSSIIHGLSALQWNRQGDYPRTLSQYMLAARYDPENPVWQISIGEAYFNLGDLAAALNAYQRATVLAPRDATYWRLLAIFCAENGVHVEDVGLPAALTAVKLAPQDPLALDALGESYLLSGRFANADQTLSDLISRYPDYYPAYIHLALTNLAQGDRVSAFNNLTYVRDASADYRDQALGLLAQYFP